VEIHRLRTLIRLAQHEVDKEIKNEMRGKGSFTGVSDWYSTGYRNALSDIILVCSDTCPATRDYWQIAKKLMDRKSKY
jgi:hypothetical protein